MSCGFGQALHVCRKAFLLWAWLGGFLSHKTILSQIVLVCNTGVLGLRPKQSDSGDSQPQLRITKEGDSYLRTMLVQGAHYILSARGPDTDLKRWGLKLAERGGKNAKKRAIVAVSRKLAVLLHRLWVSGEVYEPLRNSNDRAAEKKTAA
jgi:hypothetical protein